MENIKKIIQQYQPTDEQEIVTQQSFLQFLNAFGSQALSRDNLVGHLTVSAWILNQDSSKVLMIYHNLYQFWAWIGGHLDNNSDLLQVTQCEIEEESGLSKLELLSPSPIDLDILVVHDHYKRGRFVPRHLHYNIVFAFKSNDELPIRIKPDENSGVQWMALSDVDKLCAKDDALPYYHRIMQKMKKIS